MTKYLNELNIQTNIQTERRLDIIADRLRELELFVEILELKLQKTWGLLSEDKRWSELGNQTETL